MRISREARVLLALVAIAAAAWVWINYFSQNQGAFTTPGVATSSLGASVGAPAPSTEPGDALTPDLPVAATLPTVPTDSLSAPDTAPPVNQSGATVAPSLGSESDSVTTEGLAETTTDSNAVADATTPDTAPTGGTTDSIASAGVVSAGVAPGSVEGDSAGGDSVERDGVASGALGPESGAVALTSDGGASDGSALEAGMAEGADAVTPDAVTPDSAEPLGVVATAEPLTAREVEVAELPFLVTEPPAAETPEEGVQLELDSARPNGGLRATVNPFSPILLAPPPEQSQTQITEAPLDSELSLAPPSTPSGIVEVPIPNAPEITDVATPPSVNAPQVPTRVTAPAPQLRAPQGGLTASLPRPLPGGTLPATPELLRTTRSAPEPVAAVAEAEVAPLVELATVAALRVPGRAASPTFADAAPPALQQAEPVDAEPLPLAGLPGRGPAVGNPIAAGTSDLTRYLRDGNYRFTGYVISAVGVGVFRSNETAAPVVVTLGQTIPGTDIVLTSLKGEQAELTLNDEKQVLILNPGG